MEKEKKKLEREHETLLGQLFSLIKPSYEWEEYENINKIEKGNFIKYITKNDSEMEPETRSEQPSDQNFSEQQSETQSALKSEQQSEPQSDFKSEQPSDIEMQSEQTAEEEKFQEQRDDLNEPNDEIIQNTDIEVGTAEFSNHPFTQESPAPKKRKYLSFEKNGNRSNFVHITPQPPIARPKDKLEGYRMLTSKLRIAAKPLSSILPTANKVVSSSDWQMALDEVHFVNMLDRIDKLKEENMWSFKQLKPQVHPPRPKVRWDYVLEEMVWMSQDFHQERKWKKAAAYQMAQYVQQWHNSKDKQSLCVKVKSRPEELETVTAAMADDSSDVEMAQESVNDENDGDNDIVNIRNDIDLSDPIYELNSAPYKEAEPEKDDPNSSNITIGLDTNVYFVESGQPLDSGLSNIPTFKPPIASADDKFIEKDSIVPVSKFMLGEYFAAPSENWNTRISASGDKDQLKNLPGPQMYNSSSTYSQLFDGNSNDEEIKPPTSTKPNQFSSTGPWTTDEEDALWQLVQYYGYNWALIQDCINSSRVGNTFNRTVWCCYEKYKELKQKDFKLQGKGEYVYGPSQTNKKDKKVKVLGILSTFNYITNLAKKRDSSKSQNATAIATKANKQVNLTTHETHQQTEQQANIELNSKPLQAEELLKIKETRDKLIAATKHQQEAFYHARMQTMANRMNGDQYFRKMKGGIPQPNMGFRPNFPTSPSTANNIQSMNRPGDQFTNLMTAQQRFISDRNATEGNMRPNLGMSNRRPNLASAPIPPRNQFQADVSTAAAFVALQNAQNATKKEYVAKEANGNDSAVDRVSRTRQASKDGSEKKDKVRTLRSSRSNSPVNDSGSTNNSKVKKKAGRPPGKKRPTKSSRSTRRSLILESESEVDELDDDEVEEDELESEAVETSEEEIESDIQSDIETKRKPARRASSASIRSRSSRKRK